MADVPQALDPAAQKALANLADVASPEPVSWMPQTWGWALLAIVVIAAATWAIVRWRRRREANRYRVEALADLARLDALLADPARRGEALAAIAPLMKRTALAVWPRGDVASLSGERWIAFLRAHGPADALSGAAGRLLGDAEYRSPASLAAMSAEEAHDCARAARAWIQRHRVSA